MRCSNTRGGRTGRQVALILCLLFTSALAAAGQGTPAYYHVYFKQLVPFGIDMTHVAALQADSAPGYSPDLLRFPVTNIEPYPITGWLIMTLPDHVPGMTPADIESSVASLTAAPSLRFVSPVFI